MSEVHEIDHRIGLADTRCGADVDPEAGPLFGLQLGQHLLAGGASPLGHTRS